MDDWHYQPVSDFEQPLLARLARFPREPDMLCYGIRSASALALRAWLACYCRFRIVGRHNLPPTGPFVLFSNHTSHLDALCLLSSVPLRRLHGAFPAAAEDYFFINLPRMVLSALLINALPFNRQTRSHRSLILCRHLLSEGKILILFPEGTRSVTDRIRPFKPGIGLLLAGTRAPAVPCYISGAREAMGRGTWFPRPKRITLTIGTPRCYADRTRDRASVLQICRELEQAVEQLWQTTCTRTGRTTAIQYSRPPSARWEVPDDCRLARGIGRRV